MSKGPSTPTTLRLIQDAALSAAILDDDADALAFAGALEPARRADRRSEQSLLAPIAASVVAERVADGAASDASLGPAAGRALAGPLPARSTAESPLLLGAALLVERREATAGEAAAIAGAPITAVERARADLEDDAESP